MTFVLPNLPKFSPVRIFCYMVLPYFMLHTVCSYIVCLIHALYYSPNRFSLKNKQYMQYTYVVVVLNHNTDKICMYACTYLRMYMCMCIICNLLYLNLCMQTVASLVTYLVPCSATSESAKQMVDY